MISIVSGRVSCPAIRSAIVHAIVPVRVVFIDSPDFPYVLFLLLLMRRWPKSFPIPFHLPQHGVKDLKWQI